jgi:mannosyltransferase
MNWLKKLFFNRDRAIFGIIFLSAFLLRLPLLNASFWLDEAAQAMESARPLSQQLQITQDFQPPLIHLITHFMLAISHNEWWLRLGGALIPGMITIWATWKIGQHILKGKQGEWVGILAALLLATSSFHIFYSQELRPYSLPAMWAVLSWLCLLYSDQKKSWIFFTLTTLGGLYSSYLYPFLLIGQCLYLFVIKAKQWKSWGLSLAVTATCFLPWLPEFLNQLREGQGLRQNLPGWEEVVSFSQAKSLALVGGKFVFGVLDLDLNIIYLGAAGLLFASIVTTTYFFLKKKMYRTWQPLFLLFCWLIVPLFTAWLVSFVVPVVQPKRVLFCLPAFYLLLSYLSIGVSVEKEKRTLVRNIFSFSTIGLLLLINLFSTFSYYTQPKYQREDWRGMYQLIAQKYSPQRSIAVFGFTEAFAPWNWYNTTQFPTLATGVLSTDAVDDLPNLKKVNDYQFVLVFDYLRDLTDPHHKIEAALNSYGYKEVDRITPSTPLGIVHVYAKSSSVIGLNTVE